jgi:hypothetical protein
MKKHNLQRMVKYLRTVPQNQFDMGVWNSGVTPTVECGSVGCAIGHCLGKISRKPIYYFDNEPESGIDWGLWGMRVTGLHQWSDEWVWCFSPLWDDTDNTPQGAAARIEWLLKNGSVPKNFREQMYGSEPLCYQK